MKLFSTFTFLLAMFSMHKQVASGINTTELVKNITYDQYKPLNHKTNIRLGAKPTDQYKPMSHKTNIRLATKPTDQYKPMSHKTNIRLGTKPTDQYKPVILREDNENI